jgi:hypothetical protein
MDDHHLGYITKLESENKEKKKHWLEGEKEIVHQFQRREFGNGGWKNK